VVRTTRTSAARAPGERGHDRFARAVDSGVREASDHTMDRELAVVAALREAGDAAGPTRDEVDRMRSRVMAGAASTDRGAGSGDRVTPMPSRSGTSRRGGRHAKRSSVAAEARGRLVVAAAAALCLLLSLSGMSLLLSRDALPGDALYAFKRSAESAELGLTFGEQSRALKHLEFATARITEIERMAAAADADDSWVSGTAQFLAALDDFDSDTVAGTRLLTGVAVDGDVGILSSLQGWADQQQERLDDVRAALPAEAGGRITSSIALLDLVEQRADALQDRADCRNMTSGAVDDLGPVPAEEACVPGRLDDAASAEPLDPAPKTAAPATPDGSATVPGKPAPAGQDEEQDSERPRLRDIIPNADRDDHEDRWPDREGEPWWPDRDDSPRDPRDRLVVPLPLLHDLSVPPPSPDGPR
jgi:hypothetical protein